MSEAFSMRRYVLIYCIAFLVWFLLVATMNRQEMIMGGWVSLIVATLSYPRLAVLDGLKLTLALPLHIGVFFIVFIRALIAANFDLARRVINPGLPIQPAVVEVKTRLTSPLGKLLLANCITLTPGTLTLDVVDDRLIVHWIDTQAGEDIETATRLIAESFEQHLVKFLW